MGRKSPQSRSCKDGRKRRSGRPQRGQIGFLDLFCGTGGFSHGFINYSREFALSGAIDNQPIPAATCKANNPDAFVVCEDIRRVRPSDLRRNLPIKDIQLIVGGPPCQGFSSLRPFRSSRDDDPRNSLFESFASFVNFFRPSIFIMENVVGILTHKNGETLERIQDCFASLGYTTDWRLMNAANYGVPQKRERFVLIGVQGGLKVQFPSPTHSYNGRSIGFRDKTRMILQASGLPRAVSVMEAIGDLPPVASGQCALQYTVSPSNSYQRCRRRNAKTLTLHEAANHSQKILDIIRHAGSSIQCIPSHLITSGFTSCYSRMEPDEPATTLTVKFMSASSNKCIHPFQDRALTPREGARLQSFDDDFIFCGSRTDIVTQLGNAVPPLLGEALAESALNILHGVSPSAPLKRCA